MALVSSSLYIALRDAGAGEKAAHEAAEEIASHDCGLAALRRELALMKWMFGLSIAITSAVLLKLLV